MVIGFMKINDRVLNEAIYMLDTNKTLREIALVFGVSKSTVHSDLTKRLLKINKKLYEKVCLILKNHKEIRHIRGGEATKKKYLNISK